MCAFVYVSVCVCVCYRYRPLRRQWHSQQVNNLMCKVFFAAQQARSLAGITSHSQSFCRAIIKIHFLSTVSTATHTHTHIYTHPHTHTLTCYRWRNLVWISMAATILPLPPRALFTYAHVCVRMLCVAVRLCICKWMCVCASALCVFSQVPGSDLNAAIPFELIPKVTFDFRYDFSHFHMARAKSL